VRRRVRVAAVHWGQRLGCGPSSWHELLVWVAVGLRQGTLSARIHLRAAAMAWPPASRWPALSTPGLLLVQCATPLLCVPSVRATSAHASAAATQAWWRGAAADDGLCAVALVAVPGLRLRRCLRRQGMQAARKVHTVLTVETATRMPCVRHLQRCIETHR